MNREKEGEQEGENMDEYLSKRQTEWVGEEVGGLRERERMDDSLKVTQKFKESGRGRKRGRKSHGFVRHSIQRTYVPT